jgi:hypothetical protein
MAKRGAQTEPGDRIVIYLDPGGPVELTGLSESFASIARIYERHYPSDELPTPQLYITRLTSGSIIAEIAPFVMMFGLPTLQYLAAVNTLANFAKRIADGVKGFAGIDVGKAGSAPTPALSHDDASDLREFIKPLTGRRGARLNITHARFVKGNAKRQTIVEYKFDEETINRAAINMDRALALPQSDQVLIPPPESKIRKEVMLVFESASRRPGKEDGRTVDRATISDVTDRPLPTYFRRSVRGNLKDVMVRGTTNPLTNVAYIVDVHVQTREGRPIAYVVTDVHDTVPLADPDDHDARE